MTKVHKISLLFLFFTLLTPIGIKPVFAYQGSDGVSVSLKSLIPSDDEIKNLWDISGVSDDSSLYHPYDATFELANVCFIDCTKTVWAYSDTAKSGRLTLIMIRSKSSENAIKSAQSLWQIYKSRKSQFYSQDEFTKDDGFWQGDMDYLDKTANSIWKQQYIAVRIQGPVVIIVFYDYTIRSFVTDVNSNPYLGLVANLSGVQQQKLLKAGFKP